jgi:DNA-binding NarL/FixJ family response regulator
VARLGLIAFLRSANQLGTVGEAATGQAALTQLLAATWDVLVLELNLPDIDSLELLNWIERRRLQRSLPVLVFSSRAPEVQIMSLLRARAAGYVSKASELTEVIRAIQIVAVGGRYLSPEILEEIAETSALGANLPAHRRLTDREYQVMLRLASGKPNATIARELAIDHRTVSTHRVHILTKLGLHSTPELMRYAIAHQLLPR